MTPTTASSPCFSGSVPTNQRIQQVDPQHHKRVVVPDRFERHKPWFGELPTEDFTDAGETRIYRSPGKKPYQEDQYVSGQIGPLKYPADQWMQDIFSKLEAATRHTRDGSTATVAVAQNGRVTVGHLGDSLAFLMIKKTDGRVETHQITTDHQPSNPEEAKALQARGGKIESIRKEGVDNVLCVASNGYPMTRALGGREDDSFEVEGISSEPEIKTIDLGSLLQKKDEVILVVASDGLTEQRENGRPLGSLQNGSFVASATPLQTLAQAALVQRTGNAKDPVAAMVQVAQDNGSEDNLTVLSTTVDENTSKVLAVFDGHGRKGGETSEKAAETLKQLLHEK